MTFDFTSEKDVDDFAGHGQMLLVLLLVNGELAQTTRQSKMGVLFHPQ